MSSRAQKGHGCGLAAGRSVKEGGGGCVSGDYVRAKAAESSSVMSHLHGFRRIQKPSAAACNKSDNWSYVMPLTLAREPVSQRGVQHVGVTVTAQLFQKPCERSQPEDRCFHRAPGKKRVLFNSWYFYRVKTQSLKGDVENKGPA